MNYVWQSPGNQIEKQPVVRLDYNLTRQTPPERHLQLAGRRRAIPTT